MACEVVPIATRTGGVPEVIEHGVSGFLAEVGDVDTMARYAIDLLAMNPLCAPWANAPAPPPRRNTVPAGLFRFTKTFTERCWSNRRSRH
jgi:glycosyltransferase involved in cell wall biosynthesis